MRRASKVGLAVAALCAVVVPVVAQDVDDPDRRLEWMMSGTLTELLRDHPDDHVAAIAVVHDDSECVQGGGSDAEDCRIDYRVVDAIAFVRDGVALDGTGEIVSQAQRSRYPRSTVGESLLLVAVPDPEGGYWIVFASNRVEPEQVAMFRRQYALAWASSERER